MVWKRFNSPFYFLFRACFPEIRPETLLVPMALALPEHQHVNGALGLLQFQAKVG